MIHFEPRPAQALECRAHAEVRPRRVSASGGCCREDIAAPRRLLPCGLFLAEVFFSRRTLLCGGPWPPSAVWYLQ